MAKRRRKNYSIPKYTAEIVEYLPGEYNTDYYDPTRPSRPSSLFIATWALSKDFKYLGPRSRGEPAGRGWSAGSALMDLLKQTHRDGGPKLKPSDVRTVRKNPKTRRKNCCTCHGDGYHRPSGGTNPGEMRENPVDPMGAALSASSLAYFLAVARELKQTRRKNPSVAARVKKIEKKLEAVHQAYMRTNPVPWGELIATGAGTAVGAAVGEALATPLIHEARKALKKRKKRKNPALLIASNPSKKRRPNKSRQSSILSVTKPKEHSKDPEYKRALKMYRKFFYGDEPVEVIEVEAPEGTPRYLVSLGEAPEVTYKPPDHTSKNGVPFVHEFGEEGGTRPFLATDADGSFLGYVGGTFEITPDGIRD